MHDQVVFRVNTQAALSKSINGQLQRGWFLDASIFKPIQLEKAFHLKTIVDFGRLIALDKTDRRKIK